MYKSTADNKSKARHHCLTMAALMAVIGLTASVHTLFAQELTEEEMLLALYQYTVPYRFDSNLKAGDWVKYRIVDEGDTRMEIELEVTQKEDGGVWITEKYLEEGKLEGPESHLLIDLEKLTLLEVFVLDEQGQKQEATPLDEKQLPPIIEAALQQMRAGMAGSEIIGWELGAGKETIGAANASFDCSYLEPAFSEQYEKQAQDYGMPVEEMKKPARLYFHEDVPRLLPMQLVFGWIPFIETFKDVEGGLVRAPQMHLELTAYSGG